MTDKELLLKDLTANLTTPFTVRQLMTISQKTPPQHIKRRQGRGGMTFDYVSGAYVKKTLNDVFGWLWSYEVKEHGMSPSKKSVWVLGKLTVLNPQTHQPMIIKEQFGRADIKFLKNSTVEVDFGNDVKAAATDALKKCAAELGICSDVYADDETREEINEDYDKTIKSATELANDRERSRIIKHIENSKTVEELKQCEEYLPDDSVHEMYKAKYELLTKSDK
jgi:hypothetical protein